MDEMFLSTCDPKNPSKDGYSIDKDDYVQQLARAWPFGAFYIDLPGEPEYLASWKLDEARDPGIHGRLHIDHRTISFELDYLNSAAKYTLWHRNYLPDEVPLYAYNANYSHVVTISPLVPLGKVERIVYDILLAG